MKHKVIHEKIFLNLLDGTELDGEILEHVVNCKYCDIYLHRVSRFLKGIKSIQDQKYKLLTEVKLPNRGISFENVRLRFSFKLICRGFGLLSFVVFSIVVVIFGCLVYSWFFQNLFPTVSGTDKLNLYIFDVYEHLSSYYKDTFQIRNSYENIYSIVYDDWNNQIEEYDIEIFYYGNFLKE
ncbi:MAG: hypothetical protein N2712_01395 [Brevinematales bacterium]|nr:hypothetical protein [Brevinematales bacterium]